MKTNIESLVEEALNKLREAPADGYVWNRKQILTTLAEKASQNGLQPLPEEVPEWFFKGHPIDFRNYHWCIIREKFGTKPRDGQVGKKPELKPIIQQPIELGEIKEQLESERISHAGCGVAALGYFNGCDPKYLSASLQDVITLRKKYEELLNNQQPLEWWMGLKKGDKFMDCNGIVRLYNGLVFLGTDRSGTHEVRLCSPYTEPTTLEQFMATLTPEQRELAKSLKIEEGGE